MEFRRVLFRSTRAKAAALRPGEVMMIENLRFCPEEEANDPTFAKALADLADLFVFDAFGASHRAHASTAGVADYLPAVAGFLVGRGLRVLATALRDPPDPRLPIRAGQKFSDKFGVTPTLLVLPVAF